KLFAKEIMLGDGLKRKRLVLVKNVDEEVRAKTVRQSIITAIEQKLEHANRRRSRSHTKEVCELKSYPVYSRYIKELKNGQLKITKSRIAADGRFDGKFLIETSDETLSLTDVVFGYKQLNDVEKAFRSLKTTLELRPNYHSRDDRIRCHIFLCFLALVLARIVEHKIGMSWSKIRDEMNRIYVGEFRHQGKTISLMTELTKKQQAILAAMNIKEPSTVVGIQLE
ncbi:transposase, partial [candidate division KSB1 bacterium]|nr:transposase [candidate division KSB1 bacterium]